MTEPDRLRSLEERAGGYVHLALENMDREFPAFVLYIAHGPEDLAPRRPRDIHPVFYGSFDWHSCVEMYWLTARLLRLFPEAVSEEQVREAFSRHLTPDGVAAEVAFFNEPSHRHVERPYGWGWLLALSDELARLSTPDAERWREVLEPLTGLLATRLRDWLLTTPHPARSGLHANSAFGTRLALDYAQRQAQRGEVRLLTAIHEACLRWDQADRGWSLELEPGASDFLSPSLVEAELMSRILDTTAFSTWWEEFLGRALSVRGDGDLPWQPIEVPHDPDGQTSHLLGLNLSRAWCMNQLAGHLDPRDPMADRFRLLARLHADAALDRVHDGYMTSHWLVAYAVLYLSE
jgi:hypothetical protein